MSQKQDNNANKQARNGTLGTPYQVVQDPNQQETYGLEEIIPAIMDSQLPEGKKMAYLYMIAEGSFSLKCLEDIAIQMEVIGEKMEADKWRLKAKILEMEEKIYQMDSELDDLAISACREYKEDMDTFLQNTTEHMDAGKSKKKSEKIKNIHKGLKKTK